jgi:branched-chain amino acid transport system permease protein
MKTLGIHPRYLWFLAIAAATALPPVFSGSSTITMIDLMAIMAVLATSYNMLFGQAGLLSLGHAIFYGVPGLMTLHVMNAVIDNNWPVPVIVVPVIGGLIGSLLALVIGRVAAKRSGTAFAMITLGLGQLIVSAAPIFPTIFGAEAGIETNRSRLLPVFGLTFGSDVQVYFLIMTWSVVLIAAMYALTRTPFGLACNALRDNSQRAEFLGFSTRHVRYLALILSGFFAGAAGALAGIYFESMNAEAVSAAQSSNLVLMTFIGGTTEFWGPTIGAILVTGVGSRLSDYTDAWLMYYGIMFLFVTMYMPGGIAGWIIRHVKVARSGRLFGLVPPYLLAVAASAPFLAGGVLLVELGYHTLGDSAVADPQFILFGQSVTGLTAGPWLVGLAAVIAGAMLVNKIWPRVTDAWSYATSGAKS